MFSLQEKLRFLQRQVHSDDLGRQEREWQELEQRVATCVPKQLLDLGGSPGATSPQPAASEEGELQRSTVAILASINNLRGALESGQLRGGPGDEGGTASMDGKSSSASTLACIPLLEEIRY